MAGLPAPRRVLAASPRQGRPLLLENAAFFGLAATVNAELDVHRDEPLGNGSGRDVEPRRDLLGVGQRAAPDLRIGMGHQDLGVADRGHLQPDAERVMDRDRSGDRRHHDTGPCGEGPRERLGGAQTLLGPISMAQLRASRVHLSRASQSPRLSAIRKAHCASRSVLKSPLSACSR
jgi:hypothetical protein